MDIKFTDIIKLIEIIVWPGILLWFLIAFRNQLPQIIDQFGKRLKKISIGDLFELELAQQTEAKLNWSSANIPDLRQPTAFAHFESYAPYLIQEIESETTGDYAIIDMGIGKSWLTSRLFLFSAILEQIKGLEIYVFLEQSGGVQRRFIGLVTANVIRRHFPLHYPWFEESYMTAYLEREHNDPDSQKPGIITNEQAGNMVTGFLQNIQVENAPPPVNINEWVPVGDQQFYEHCKWINSTLLFETLGDDLKTDCMIDDSSKTKPEIYSSIIMQKGRYIALVDTRGEFKSLVDREKILEEIGKNIVLQKEKENNK